MYHSYVVSLALLSLVLCDAPVSAAVRTWQAASGRFSVEAEFIELRPGDVVRLKKSDGTQIDVPLAKLSAADQDFVRNSASVSAAPTRKNRAKSSRVVALERQADRCPSAEEAVGLYRIFSDDPQTTDEDRQVIAKRFEDLRLLAEQKMMRMKGKWVSTEEYRRVREKANVAMKQGLEMLRLKQEDGFHKKFAEASQLEPDGIRADMIAGLIFGYFGVLDNDQAKAQQYFEKCAKRDADSVAVMNNLALTDLKRGNVNSAIFRWRKAAQMGPDQAIVQNLGRLLDLTGSRKIQAAAQILEIATTTYTTLLGNSKFQRADLKRGFYYSLIDAELASLGLNESKENQKEQQRQAPNVPEPSEDGSVVVSGGTGFVIAPHYILTNNHVIDEGTVIDIQTSDPNNKRLYRAKVVAHSKKPDLALLQCEELEAPALPFDVAVCGRGTEILTLGYPEMFRIGATLKATKGVISALPNPAVEDMYLYDATVNGGNSGGPVFDIRGNVVAVTTIGVRTEVQYGGGIPSSKAIEFVKQNLPGFTPLPPGTSALEWPAVDQKASPSVVLVWKRAKPGSSVVAAGGDARYLEDPQCMVCNGVARARCQAEGCNNGMVSRTMRSGTRTKLVQAQCPACNGQGVIGCPACRGIGLDLSTTRGAAVLAAREAAVAAAQQPATTAPPQMPDSRNRYPYGRMPPGMAGPPGMGMPPGMPPGGLPPGVVVVRRQVPVELIEIGEEETRHLAKDLKLTKLDVVQKAAEKLAKAKANEWRSLVAPGLVTNLTRGDWPLQSKCCEALVLWGEDAKGLVKALGAKARPTRYAAIRCLGLRGDDESIAVLVEHVRKPREFEKKAAEFDADDERNKTVSALIKIGAKAQTAVESIKDDADPEVRVAALKILQSIETAPKTDSAAASQGPGQLQPNQAQ